MDNSRMGESSDVKDPERDVSHEVTSPENTDVESVTNVQKYDYDESRKIGVTGATFLILNKMIGTGSESISSSDGTAVHPR
jgi:hypothetical protein